MEFSNLKMKEVLKSQTSKRVSKDAAEKLSELLEEHGRAIAREANSHAEDDGRVTVRREDILRALED